MNQRERDFRASVAPKLAYWRKALETLTPNEAVALRKQLLTRNERRHIASYGRRRSTYALSAWR